VDARSPLSDREYVHVCASSREGITHKYNIGESREDITPRDAAINLPDDARYTREFGKFAQYFFQKEL